jgi:hypothetical protein
MESEHSMAREDRDGSGMEIEVMIVSPVLALTRQAGSVRRIDL